LTAALFPAVLGTFFLPLAFGGTTPSTSAIFDGMLVRAFLVWLCVLVLERRLPRLPVVPLVAMSVLAVLAFLQISNPRSFLDPTYGELVPVPDHRAGWPGSVDRDLGVPVLLHLGALFLGGVVLVDSLSGSRARWLLFRSVALAGLIIALVGIWQKASGAEAMLWTTPSRSGETFFGAFRYHANAASFLNLSWPAALAVWLRGRLTRPGSLVVSLDFCVLFFLLAAVFINSSKAGQVIGLAGAALAAWRFRTELVSSPMISRSGAVVLGLFLLALFSIFLLPGILTSMEKWSDLGREDSSLRIRLLAYSACVDAISGDPWFGTGAGTFHAVFPYHTLQFEDRIAGFWYFAHQDYLQTLIEWGAVGTAAWVAIYAGAILRLMRRRREARRQDRNEIVASTALIALFMVLVHALVDFPLQIPSIQWLVVFYLSIGWSSPGLRRGPAYVEEAEEGRRPAAGASFESNHPVAAISTKVRVSET